MAIQKTGSILVMLAVIRHNAAGPTMSALK